MKSLCFLSSSHHVSAGAENFAYTIKTLPFITGWFQSRAGVSADSTHWCCVAGWPVQCTRVLCVHALGCRLGCVEQPRQVLQEALYSRSAFSLS